MAKRRSYGRTINKEFARALKTWREAVPLTQDKASRKLGIKSRCPGAYLSQIETGNRPIPDAVLLKVPKVYKQPSEKVLKLAYSPQLPFPILATILENQITVEQIEVYLRKSKFKLNKEEKMELLNFANFLVLRRKSQV